MLDLAFLTILAFVSLGVGLRIARRLSPLPDHPSDALALALPVGLGTLALSTFGLAELGLLSRAWLAGLAGLGTLIGAVPLREWFQSARRQFSGDATRFNPSGLAFDAALALVLLGTLLTALGPVTDGDALCYHLQVPKIFLARGGMAFEPDLHETIYPLVTEMLYAVTLAFRGPVACRLVQWLLGVTFALNVSALARPILGDRARWAATVALLVPAVSNGMGAPLNDVALAAFGNATLFAVLRWRERPTAGAAVLAGILGGLAIGVKYPALVWVGLLGVGMTLEAVGMRRSHLGGTADVGHGRHSRPYIFLFGLAVLLVGGGWYLRAYVHTGNPVFPFFRQTFGGAGIADVLDPIKRPMDVTPWNLLTALVPMTLSPDRFDSVSHQFGPVFLLFLPALFVMKPPRRVVGLVALGWLFLTLCLTQRQSMRFLLIAIGPMSVGVAWLAAAWRERKSVPARMVLGMLVLLIGAESLLAVGRSRHGLKVVVGRESAEAFLARREPTYLVGRWMERHLPESARVIGQDHRGFYLPRPYTMELAHRRRTGLGTKGESPEAIVEALRERGFTHVLLCPPVPESAVEFDPTLGRKLQPWLSRNEPIYREDLSDADGVVRRYALYPLSGDMSVATTSDVRASR